MKKEIKNNKKKLVALLGIIILIVIAYCILNAKPYIVFSGLRKSVREMFQKDYLDTMKLIF